MSATRRLEFIARTQLTGAAVSVSFATGLSGFTKFFLVGYCVANGTAQNWNITINNDTGANYSRQTLDCSSSTIYTTRSGPGATNWGVSALSANKENQPGVFGLEISKPVAGLVARSTFKFSYMNNDATTAINYGAFAGEWSNTADLINRIDVNSNVSFAAGTRVLLYGSKD